MRLIGLTGGIASGKTMITDYLADLGAPVVDADKITHMLQEPGSPVLREIAAAFGEDCLDKDGNLDRPRLAGLIFDSEENRRKLNQIMHPRIGEAIQAEIRRYADAGEAVAIFSAPLLLEGGRSGMTDEIWVVALDPAEQVRRLMDRDGIGEEEAQKRLAAQSSLQDKLANADRVIDNNGSREEARKQAKALWEEACGV